MARLLGALLCATVLATGGEDLLTPGEQLQRELRLALSLGKQDEALRLLDELGALVRYPASPQEAASLVELAGAATARKHPRPVVVAALRALGEAGLPAGVDFVVPFLQAVKPRPEDREVTLAAIRAAGLLRSTRLVARLVELARKSPDLTLADQSLAALSEFWRAPTELRRQVADKTLEVCQWTSRRRPRWVRLQAPGLRALQRLVGRRLNSLEQFALWWKAVRDREDPFSEAAGSR